jgi:hypothetical protein
LFYNKLLRKFKKTARGFKLNGTHQLLVYADEQKHKYYKKKKTLASMETVPKVNDEKT